MCLAFKNRDPGGLLLTAVVGMYLFGIVITSGIPRFRAPMSPEIVLLGALALKFLYDRIPRSSLHIILAAWTALNVLAYAFAEPLRRMVKSVLI